MSGNTRTWLWLVLLYARGNTCMQLEISRGRLELAGGSGSSCRLHVEELQTVVDATLPKCLGDFDAVRRGRRHLLLTHDRVQKLRLQATCGIRESPVLDVTVGTQHPWVLISADSLALTLVTDARNKIWKNFFGALSLLLFIAELVVTIFFFASLFPCCVLMCGICMLRTRLVRLANTNIDTFEYVRMSLENKRKSSSSTGQSSDAPRKELRSPENFEKLKSEIVELMEKQIPPISGEKKKLTPSQRFYRENKELLLKRVSEIYSDENQETKKFPVVRPPLGHLWTFGEDPAEYIQPEFEAGKFPSSENILILLANEQVFDLKVVDLQSVGRRDLGEICVVGSVQNAKHGKRVAELLVNKINSLDVPQTRASSPISDRKEAQDWAVVHFGGFVVHLMTTEIRGRFNVEGVLLDPEIWLTSTAAEDFPHYSQHWASFQVSQ